MDYPPHKQNSSFLRLLLLSLCSVVTYLLLINGGTSSKEIVPQNEAMGHMNSKSTSEEHQFLASNNDSVVYSNSPEDITTFSRLLQELLSGLEQPLPSIEEEAIDLDLSKLGSNGKVSVLMNVSAPDFLIVLARRNLATDYIPVSRSYDGHDWEATPGLHQRLPILCDAVDGVRKCQLELEKPGRDDVYFLTKYSHSSSNQAKVARFLEMATFGPTMSEINSFNHSNIDRSMALYVKDQIQNRPINSHREFYRKHLNVRAVETYKHGVTGPKACDRHSRWRSFAFTTKDLKMSQLDESFTMRIENLTVSSTLDNITVSSTAYVIKFAGYPRTVLYKRPQYYLDARDQTVVGNLTDGEYELCYVEDIEGSKRVDTPYLNPPTFKVKVDGTCRPVLGGNPTVHLDFNFVDSTTYHELDLKNSTLIPLDIRYSNGSSLLLDNDIDSATCSDIPDPQDATHKSFGYDCNDLKFPGDCDHYKMNSWRHPIEPVFGKQQDGTYLLYDSRLQLDENTIENPLIDGGGNKVVASTFVANTTVFDSSPRPAYYCSNAPQNIFNEEHCVLSFDPNVCVSYDTAVMKAIAFDEQTLADIFSITGRYVYAVKGLVFDDTIHPDTATDGDVIVDLPCNARTRSRWLRLKSGANGDWIRRDETTAACTNSLDNTTESQFESAILSSTDQNPHFKDVYFRGSCAASDNGKHDMLVYVAEEDQCYQNVHPDYLSIYDVSNWAPSPDDVVNHHPGGSAAIRKWTESGFLTFPAERYAWHTMDRWHEFSTKQESFGTFVARLGDSIKFEDLPAELQTENVANLLGASKLENVIGNNGGTLVCGSQGEVAPDPMEDDYFEINLFDTDTLDTMLDPQSQKQTIWTHLSLSGEDQLRQKMAWALSQILVISPNSLTDSRATEPFLVFYDIFVRNGLGNYRDVLKEVSFSVKMGEMLTFKDNRALGYLWHIRKQIQHPDENYARELMQLFTIGLVRLNIDGSEVLDDSGSPLKTYDSKDIVSFARAWTGFTMQPYRGNVEDINAPTRNSYLDPMRIQDIRFRDIFPKRGLDGKFIGDRYPLCSDLPERAFLKKGAKYKLLGGNPSPKWQHHTGVDWNDPLTKRFVVHSGSALYDALQCKVANEACTFQPIITLSQTLPCSGDECKVDTVRTVQVGSVFYEYIRMPCVHLSFYEDGKKLSAGRDDNLNMCGNPKVSSASEACCGVNRDTDKLVFDNPRRADRSCVYLGEKVTYATNAERCYDLGGYPCDLEGFLYWNENSNQDCIGDSWSSNNWIWNNIWHWTNAECRIQVAVKSSGLVALHHNPDKSGQSNPPPNAGHVDVLESLNYFSVHWERNETSDEQFPSVENGCGHGACEVFDDATCLCDTTVFETVAFEALPTRAEALSQLTIGAFDPDSFEEDHYELVETSDGIEAWRKRAYSHGVTPTPSPSDRCARNLINWNGDAETATVAAWYRWGEKPIELEQPGYDSKFALRYHPEEESGNMLRGIFQYLPIECLNSNDAISIAFKVKLVNATDDSPISCDPSTISSPDACPFVRLEIQNNGVSRWIGLNGLRKWKTAEWNSYTVDYIIPSEYDAITRFRPFIVLGGPSVSDGRVLLVDDVEILKDSSIATSESPSSSPTSSCLFSNMGVNGGAETGLAAPYGNTGTNTSLTVQSDDVFSGNYAFKFKAYEWYRGMNKGVWDMEAPSPGQREAQCISAGTTLHFEFKVRLVEDNGTYLEELSCDPGARTMGGDKSQTDSSGCPFLRAFVHSNGRWIAHDLWGIEAWEADSWSSFSATWTVPDYGYPIKMFQIQFVPNRHSQWPNDNVYMLMDDFEYFVVPVTGPPSKAPTVSAFPSYSPTLLPSREPSQYPTSFPTESPTDFPDYTSETIFRVLDEKHEFIYLKNVESNVQIGNRDIRRAVAYTIRNPPSFHDLSDTALRDAYYETDAVVDHLLYHDNTPTYVSKLLIQHFGISNPSPRYIKAVSTAFRTGSYTFEQASEPDVSFGEQKWGDLGATAAAILLDREARAVVVEADPVHGSIREPMAKVIAVMRSLEFTRAAHSKLKYPILESGVQEKIGQMPHSAPDVFSFFSSGYQPAGSFAQSSLVSPESQVLSMITVVGMLNGLSALIKNDLSPCGNGFGRWLPAGFSCDYPVGRLDYSPSAVAISGEKVVDELALLLTSGRLSEENKEVILKNYNAALASDNEENALKVAQQLMLASPEFQTSNIIRKTGNPRKPSASAGSTTEPYKAIINVHLFGGMDSFYMLSPHSSCSLYTEYNDIRGEDATLASADMHSLDATSSFDQPCYQFGLHKNLDVMKELYDSDMGLFVANAGHLEKPVTKNNYYTETKAQLFAHNSMEDEAAFVDGFRENVGTGVLGRMLDVLQQQDFGVSAVAMDRHGPILDGNSKFGRPADVIKRSGIDKFYDNVGSPSNALTNDEMKDAFKDLNGNVKSNSGKYADHWSQAFVNGIDKAASLRAAIEKVTLTHQNSFTNGLGQSLGMIAKLIKAREDRGVNRDAFHVRVGGWDHHAGLKTNIEPKFLEVNAALDAFKKEMEALGLMDQITLVVTSEFARTLSPNSGAGTDHAWGGNYFMMGGALKGGRILGEYPKGFTKSDPTNDGRGRLVPTTPWESIWNGVAQWYGISDEENLDYVLPNRGNFGCRLFSERDLYKEGTQTNVGCGGDIIEMEHSLFLNEARYLAGAEQKEFCNLITKIAVGVEPQFNFRCIILDQKIVPTADDLCTHELKLVTELSTDAVGLATKKTDNINRRSQEILSNPTEYVNVTGVCDLGTTVTPSGEWGTIIQEGFESGYGNFTTGGRDARIFNHLGHGESKHSLELRDNSLESNAFVEDPIDVSEFSKVRLTFYYRTRNVGEKERFVVQFSKDGGKKWKRWKSFRRWKPSKRNEQWYKATLYLKIRQSTETIMLRFKSSFDNNNRRVFIDDVTFSGYYKEISL